MLTVLALGIAACGGGDASPGGPPDGIVLTVTDEGGFVPLESLVGRLPRYVLQSDGTLYAPAPIAAIYPGPLVAPVTVGNVGASVVDEIRRLAEQVGLPSKDRIDDPGPGNVADATTTVFTYRDANGTHVLRVYALGIAGTDSKVADVASQMLSTLDRAASSMQGAGDYAPDRLEVWSVEGLALPDPALRRVRPWPLQTAPDALPEVRPGRRCTVISGPDAEETIATFLAADQATVWDLDGTPHSLIVRILLPGEPGCA